jgi:multidrug efflux system outer membrane protein
MIHHKSLYLPLVAIMAGCTLQPAYQRSPTPMLSAWREEFPLPQDAKIGQQFWNQFNDPILNDYVELALKHNLDLNEAIENVLVFLERYGVVRSKLFPQINLQGTGEKEKVGASPGTVTSASTIGNSFDLVMNAGYLIDFWGEVRSASKSAYHTYLASVHQRKAVLLSVVSSTLKTYFLLRQYDRQLEIANQTIATRKESYRLALIRFQLGLTSQIQVEQALSLLEFANLEAERLKIAIGVTEDLMAVLIGEPTTPVIRGEAIQCLTLPEAVDQPVPSKILDQRPDLMRSEQELMALNADIGVAKAKFFPQFNFNASYGFDNGVFSQLFQQQSSIWSYGLTLLQEIFTGGRLTSNLKLSQANQRKGLYRYHQAILNAFKETNDAFITHRYNLEIIQTQKIRVEALERYLNLALLQYNEGLIDYLTYLDAERQVFEAKLAEAGSIANSFISYVSIYQAIGGPWVDQADDKRMGTIR